MKKIKVHFDAIIGVSLWLLLPSILINIESDNVDISVSFLCFHCGVNVRKAEKKRRNPLIKYDD